MEPRASTFRCTLRRNLKAALFGELHEYVDAACGFGAIARVATDARGGREGLLEYLEPAMGSRVRESFPRNLRRRTERLES